MTPDDRGPDNDPVTATESPSPGSDYRVDVEVFHGPLDLLLYLVRKNEVDILDIPISLLTDQFLAYLPTMQVLNVELAGEFVVTAATLMEIKSRSLIPTDPVREGDDEGPDPRRELVRQLLEYRRYKDAAVVLEERAEAQATRLPRQPLPEPSAPGQIPVRPVELWDLVSAFARLMRETQALAPTTIQVDDTPQHVYEEMIRSRLRLSPRVAFRELFSPPWTRGRLIGLFLAILELIKNAEVWLEQPDPFGEIWLGLAEPGQDLRAAASC